MRRRQVGKRVGAVQHRPQRARLGQAHQGLQVFGPLGRRAANAAAGAARAGQHLRQAARHRQVAAMLRQARQAGGKAARTHRVGHHVPLLRVLGEVLLGVVDHGLCAQRPGQRHIAATAHRRDMRAPVPRQLHHGAAHRARCANHQQRFARAQVGLVQKVQRRQATKRQAGRVHKRQALGLVHQGPGAGQQAVLGMAAHGHARHAHHRIAGGKASHCAAYGLHHACHVGAQHRLARPRDAKRQPPQQAKTARQLLRAHAHVGRRHTGRQHPHQHIARARHGAGQGAQPQHIGAAIAVQTQASMVVDVGRASVCMGNRAGRPVAQSKRWAGWRCLRAA